MEQQEHLEVSFATRLSTARMAELAKLYNEGASIAELAAKFHMTETNIRLALRRASKKESHAR